ncbi:ATP-grasp domain-containing protein [Lichenihabitans psoromatis]|uniref:ATP-grasp domain-containing protein n=1 Tax=Lichenihabitans psoromatis TaxID=2528642 RepID=UPI00103845B8|nr:ATP-grasp domain-containing protein [Lichenihabitans psoromatis]
MSKKRRLLLLAESFRLPYRVMRCAAASGDEIFVLGTSDAANLKISNSCKKYIPIEGSFSDFVFEDVQKINAIAAHFDISCILPSCPMTTRFLSVHGDSLTTRHFPVPSSKVFDLLDNKWSFAEFCVELGVPHPPTRHVATPKELQFPNGLGQLIFPLMLKPLSLWGSAGISKINRIEDLPAHFDHTPMVAQSYIPGQDICAFYLCDNGVIVRSIQYIKTERRVTFVNDSRIDENALSIISHLNYNGVIGFDIRRDPAGEIYFIECNPRFWYRIHFASIIGINFVKEGLAINNGSMQDAKDKRDVTVMTYSALAAHLFMPWRLTTYDFAMLRYLAVDPFPTMLTILQRAFGPTLTANGAHF